MFLVLTESEFCLKMSWKKHQEGNSQMRQTHSSIGINGKQCMCERDLYMSEVFAMYDNETITFAGSPGLNKHRMKSRETFFFNLFLSLYVMCLLSVLHSSSIVK